MITRSLEPTQNTVYPRWCFMVCEEMHRTLRNEKAGQHEDKIVDDAIWTPVADGTTHGLNIGLGLI